MLLLKRFGLDAPDSAGDSPVRVDEELLGTLPAPGAGRLVDAADGLSDAVRLAPAAPDGRLPAGVRIAGPSIRIARNHPAYIERLKRVGHQVHVDQLEDIDLCIDLGVDAIITNRPAAVLHRLGR
ncbi:Glycerophosphodiester phosphodiesterase OS=Streptomyces alboniger OX=132473 GN=CP975_17235 PE=4 SV=1 [Streptomyces alboniger]